MTDMVEVMVNGRWPVKMPDYRAERPEWPWWEATRLAAMAHYVGEDDVVWDVGTEEGDLTALFALWGAQVYLIEPNPRVWPNVRAIWEANFLPEPLGCWPGFVGELVGDPPDRALWEDDTVWPRATTEHPLVRAHGFSQYGEDPGPTTTVDALVADGVPAPSVITMDVEGAELHVLRGAAVTLDQHQPLVFASVHPGMMLDTYGIPDGAWAVRTFMAEHDYQAEHLATDHEEHFMFTPMGRP